MHASDAPRARLHPLVVACIAAIAARGLNLILHFTSRDPRGNRISAAPLETLLLAVPYHGAVLITSAALLLSVIKERRAVAVTYITGRWLDVNSLRDLERADSFAAGRS